MSTEDLLIKNIEGAIRGIKLGSKTPQEVGSIVSNSLSRLKPYNEGMADDLLRKYKEAVEDRKEK